MLTCGKCGAKGFVTVEEDEFHCVLCGFVWYPGRERGKTRETKGKGARAQSGRRILCGQRRETHGQE